MSDPRQKDDHATQEPAQKTPVSGAASGPGVNQDAPASHTSHADTTQDTIQGAIPSGNAIAFGSYAAKNTNPLRGLSSKDWLKSEGTPWSATPHGRIAIRTFSRGLLGAAFFAIGGQLTEKWMTGSKLTGAGRYNEHKGFMEQENPLHFIAKGIDTFVSKPIEWGASLVGGAEFGAEAVHFRPTKYHSSIEGGVNGRSLGNEVVNVTFDFFSASIGDAMGRDIANLVDPNVKKPWYDKDGHFSLTEAAKNAGKAAFRYVTYNGGEDWAVAVPYVYFMKGQRRIIDNLSPGFKYDFDRGLNGGSFKVNNNLKVTGSYGIEGMIDLQTRFTVYNIGTLMYRELYNHVGNLLQGRQSSLYGAPDAPDKDKRSFVQHTNDIGKWMLRSAIKGTLYMTPSVPFFWISRAGQTKDHGVFVNPEKGILEHFTDNRMQSLRVYELKKPNSVNYVPQGDELFYGNYIGNQWQPKIPTDTFANPFNQHFDPYVQKGNMVDRAFGKIGQWHANLEDRLDPIGEKLDRFIGEQGLTPAMKAVGFGMSDEFLTRAARASISYTPYMASKAEFANMWDDGKMDLSIERMIDGVASFKWGEFKAGAGEVYNSILRRPLADPQREAEAQRRIDLDSSAPVSFVQTQGQRRAEKVVRENARIDRTIHPNDLSWQERTVAGRNASPEHEKLQPDSRPRSFAENEAMKKALEELSPPTSALH